VRLSLLCIPVCYFLTIASPLTLSEVRSMLPRGIVAQPADPSTTAAFRRVHPTAQTVATLFSGACSCDFVRARSTDYKEDERHLRHRYFQAGYTRDRIVRALDRHRRRTPQDEAAGMRADALAAFVAEHARNAGPTLYHLRFAIDPDQPTRVERAPPVTRAVRQVGEAPERWIEEGPPVLVVA